ncbi:MAG TPA: 16S rRNA (guanine(527)-N(7))-methyltransferase RsmG [Cyanobacteria bacterium UBA11049]|nr:16S rRNA (guanine(527)-N(7))-methyltransferase RsmG [Cyanobacteria bacterium UBA11049]
MTDDIPMLPQMADAWQHLNWQPNAEQQLQFQHLYELIIKANQTLNLTRITEPLDFWEKHLWDSLRGIMPLLKDEGRRQKDEVENSAFSIQHSAFKIVDIGTGAGFPGIPTAIARPDSQVTLLDSTRKKIAFLDSLIAELGIRNVNTVTGRAEVVGKESQHQQAYDVALIRAVGSASVCAEYALPFLKSGGLAVLYRGNWTTEEAETLQNTVKRLGGAIEKVEQFTTPLSNSIRHCVYLRK